MIDRAELPVQMNRALYCRSSTDIQQQGLEDLTGMAIGLPRLVGVQQAVAASAF